MTIKLLVESGNYFGDNRNFGDLAIARSAVTRLRGLWPGCDIRWVTADAGAARAHGPGLTPVAPAAIAADAPPPGEAGRAPDMTDALRDSDIVLATGGGYFSDKFAAHACGVLDTLEAGLRLGKPAAIMSCGFEPVADHALLDRMLAVLPRLDLIVCREPLQSPDVLRSAGVSPDRLCVAGDEAIEFAFERRPRELGDRLGVNIRCADYAGVGPGTLAGLRAILNESVGRLNARLVRVPISEFGPSDVEAIDEILRDLIFRIDDRGPVTGPDDVVARAGECRLVVTGSYHAAVFALSQGASVVALVASSHYRAKFRGLEAGFGAGIRIVELGRPDTGSALALAIEDGWRDATAVRQDLLRAAERQIVQLRDAYRRLGGMIEGRSATATAAVPAARMERRGTPSGVAAPSGVVEPPPVTTMRQGSMPPVSAPGLSAEEIETFRTQGYLGPFTAFDPEAMERARQVILDRVLTTPTRYCPFGLRVRHLDSRTVYDLCSSPAILARMASLYGPDLVLWNSNLFNKPPASPDQQEEYPWHQDHYNWNMEPVLNISAWLAIGPATEQNGCVQVIPGSHRQIVPPVMDTNPHLSLRFGGVASDPRYVDESRKVSLPLQSGQFFLFNERLLHHSNPNRTDRNRLGLAIRVTVPIVKVSEPFPCMLLSGQDRMGFNRYVDPPREEPDAEWLASLPLEHAFVFDRPIPGMGWHLLENDGSNSFAWTGLEPAAWLDFRPVGSGDHIVRCEVVHAISQQAIDAAALRVNGVAVDIERRQEGAVIVLEGRVPGQVLRQRPDRVRVQIEGGARLRPCDVNPESSDKRSLGLGVRRVALSAVQA
jgi:polysaccharide pyruvyl transferase WcaK-like protein